MLLVIILNKEKQGNRFSLRVFGMKSRNTIQKGIMQKEAAKFDSFFTAQELFEKARAKDNRIGLATIYRFLAEMREGGALYSYSCSGRAAYSTLKRSHCHFICEETGRVIHFDVDSLDFLRDKLPGEISSFQIEVRGKCSDCGKNGVCKKPNNARAKR
jgi:Fe2+ or Zn2+ uptake regulation protein